MRKSGIKHSGRVCLGIKMAVVEDRALFELPLVHTKFGTVTECLTDSSFQDECDLIVGKAMRAMSGAYLAFKEGMIPEEMQTP